MRDLVIRIDITNLSLKNRTYTYIMRFLSLLLLCVTTSFFLKGQNLIIEEGNGVGPLKLGQSFEEVVITLGFDGEL